MLRQVPIGELAHRCRDETLRFLRSEQSDDSYCLEIFQRAVVDRDEDAWSAIVQQYRGIILAYANQHSAAAQMQESDDFWVNRAFQRFWTAVGPERFGQFPDLAALLRYLKLCVHSVIMDEIRARRARQVWSLDDVPESTTGSISAEVRLLADIAHEQLWAVVLDEAVSPAEQQVMYLSFARDLKPSEIYDRRPELFDSVADVYRIKRNVLQRLRRSPRIKDFLGS